MFEQEQEIVELDIDESNELLFKLNVEGANNDSVTRVRLVCESGDLSYAFTGKNTQELDVIKFTIPSMKGKLSEGTYKTRLEVMVDSRYFVPVELDINFKKVLSVVAESITHNVIKEQKKSSLQVSASRPIIVNRQKPIIEEVEVENEVVEKQSKKSSGLSLKERYGKRKILERKNVVNKVIATEDDVRKLVKNLLTKDNR